MWTCKQVSKALEQQDYKTLPPLKKFLLRFHVAWCFVCGKYNKQVMLMQDTCREFKEHEEEVLEKSDPMSDDRKAQLDAALKAELGK